MTSSALVVLWLECPGTCLLVASRSTDGGHTWSPAVLLSAVSYDVLTYHWQVAGQKLVVAWQSDTSEIYFRRSTDSGATWGPIANLSNSPSATSRWPHVAAPGGGNVYVVWRETVPAGTQEAYLRRSTNSGASFDPALNLSGAVDKNAGDPSIAVSGSNIYVGWPGQVPGGNRAIFLRRSDDGGAIWSPAVRATPYSSYAWFNPDLRPLAAAGQIALIAYDFWVEPRNEVDLVRSLDGGTTFSAPQVISPAGAFDSRVMMSSTRAFYLWGEYTQLTPVTSDLMFRRSVDLGATWLPAKNVSNNQGYTYAWIAAWAFNGPNLHIVWQDGGPGNVEILYRRSTDAGASFGPLTNLSQTPGFSGGPGVVVVGGYAYVVWFDAVTIGGNADIFLTRTASGSAALPPSVPGESSGPGGVSDPNPSPNNWCRQDLYVSGNAASSPCTPERK
ncbi:MAG TPA: sialidase family protein [bacterium]